LGGLRGVHEAALADDTPLVCVACWETVFLNL
jgi:hypothetical protein